MALEAYYEILSRSNMSILRYSYKKMNLKICEISCTNLKIIDILALEDYYAISKSTLSGLMGGWQWHC